MLRAGSIYSPGRTCSDLLWIRYIPRAGRKKRNCSASGRSSCPGGLSRATTISLLGDVWIRPFAGGSETSTLSAPACWLSGSSSREIPARLQYHVSAPTFVRGNMQELPSDMIVREDESDAEHCCVSSDYSLCSRSQLRAIQPCVPLCPMAMHPSTPPPSISPVT